MSNVFISYAREDRPKAEILAKALKEEGWSVWWDKIIPPGKTFDEVIEEAINAAQCVVVLWSELSKKSDWVKEEANIGKQRNILVPVKVEPVDPPIGFGRIQAADLIDWKGDKGHQGFMSLRNAILEITGPPPEGNKNVQSTKLPGANLVQHPDIQSEENETSKTNSSQPDAGKQESSIRGSRKLNNKRLTIGAGIIVLVLIVGVLSWRFLKQTPMGNNMETEIQPEMIDKPSPIGEKEMNLSSDECPICESFAFDPQVEKILLENIPEFNPKNAITLNAITLEAWFKTDAFSTRQAIISILYPYYKMGEPYHNNILELEENKKLNFALTIADIRRYIDQAFFPVELNKWYHVAATYDGVDMKIYLGAKKWESIGKYQGQGIFFGKSLVIGGDTSGYPFKGKLAEVRIWNVARTEGEIREGMNKIIPPGNNGLVWTSTNWFLNKAQVKPEEDSTPVKESITKDETPFRLSEVDQPPRTIRSAQPQYPIEAKKNGLEGKVKIKLIVDSNGNVQKPEVVETIHKGIFDEAALEALKKYKFRPAMKGGKAVSCNVKMYIPFALEETSTDTTPEDESHKLIKDSVKDPRKALKNLFGK